MTIQQLLNRTVVLRILSACVLVPPILWIFSVCIILCAGLALYEWIALSLKTPHRIILSVSGFIYVMAGFFCAYVIRTRYGVSMAFLFISLVWLTDIAAYGVGKSIGGAKLIEAVSPNKTWVGFFGGIIAAVAVALIFGMYLKQAHIITHLWHALFVGVVMGITGQAGDLVASVLKRFAKASDSGDLIPGHGGALDRLDSMILMAPIFLLMITFLPHVFTTSVSS